MYIIKTTNDDNSDRYVALDICGQTTLVCSEIKAKKYATLTKATNTIKNLSSFYKGMSFQIINLESETDVQEQYSDLDMPTSLQEIIKTVSQLPDYRVIMKAKEKECDDKILDIRHYIRNKDTRLNCIQMQRLMRYLQKLERDREIYKKNRTVADLFVEQYENLADVNYIKEISKIYNTPYKPRALSDEDILKIVNTKQGDAVA